MSGPDWIVAATIATEIPPRPQGPFTREMIPVAIAAICDVIRNRVHDPRFPDTAVEVVLQPRQFSAVCREDYWRRAMAGLWEPSHMARCLEEWQHPAEHATAPGATHYYSPVSMVPPDREPSWIHGMTEVPVAVDKSYFRFFK